MNSKTLKEIFSFLGYSETDFQLLAKESTGSAIDDLGDSFFSVEDFREYLNRCEMVSEFHDIYESTLANDSTGYILYLGRRQRKVMLRIYHK